MILAPPITALGAFALLCRMALWWLTTKARRQ